MSRRNAAPRLLTPGIHAWPEPIKVGGVPFVPAHPVTVSEWLLHIAAPNRIPVNVRLANAYNVALANRDADYLELLSTQGINFPDGTPVVWAMRLRYWGISSNARRVRGPSLFARTLENSIGSGVKHFFLGGSPETLARLRQEVIDSYPGIIISGCYSPPFAAVDEAFIKNCVDTVVAADADIVWIGLGTPKQDQVGTEIAERTRTTTVNVGAAFDFSAGTIREAPHWVQNSGFEWLYRLITEPRRLWRRYTFGNLRFLWAVASRWE
jgi:N-acetylglucosaminyldiphosphoundecaprenol N-acetyl-beta-D-mannosaminyltransferase